MIFGFERNNKKCLYVSCDDRYENIINAHLLSMKDNYPIKIIDSMENTIVAIAKSSNILEYTKDLLNNYNKLDYKLLYEEILPKLHSHLKKYRGLREGAYLNNNIVILSNNKFYTLARNGEVDIKSTVALGNNNTRVFIGEEFLDKYKDLNSIDSILKLDELLLSLGFKSMLPGVIYEEGNDSVTLVGGRL